MNAARAARVAALLALLVAPSAAAQNSSRPEGVEPAGTWQDTTYVDAVIRLAVDNGPITVIPALTYGSVLLLPVRQVFELIEVNLPVFVLRDSAVAMLHPGNVPLLFRPSARLLTRGAVVVPYDSIDIVWWDGDLFVATAVLDRVLGVSTGVDWSSLSATMAHTAGLPVVLRARRERRRTLLADARRPSPNVIELPLTARTVDGAVMSWSLTATRQGPTDQMALDVGFGGGLLGGSAELRPVFWSAAGSSGSDLRWSWSRVVTGSGHVSQVRVGDVQSNGRRARLLEGIVVTNAPYIRSSEFDVEQFVTDVPAGWEAELYESGRLLGYADADAMGAFRVPLQLGYGQNPFELVLYGPGGETVRQQRTIRVPFSRIPRQHLEYAFAAGRCYYEPCRALMSADGRYGLSRRVTVQAGWDAFFRDDRPTLWQPYLVVSGSPIPALGLTGEAVANGHLRVSANFEPTARLRATAGHTRLSATGARFGGTFVEASRSEASLFWQPAWRSGAAVLQGSTVLSSGPDFGRRLVRLASSLRVGRVRYSAGVLRDAVTGTRLQPRRRLAFDGGADAALAGPWRWLATATVRGQLAVEPGVGVTAVRTMVSRRISHALRLDASTGWLRGEGASLELGFHTSMPGPSASVRSRVTERGSQSLVTSSGAVAYDPRSHLLRLSDASAVGRAGISGVLFRDDNANGVRDRGEPGLAGIPVHVGGWPAQTDAEGRFAAWGMFPTAPASIFVDTLSFEDPQLVLPAPILQVRPQPNAFGAVAVPVVVGGEIGGYVVLGQQPLGGVPVVLRELNTGAEITVMTFADGGFYRGGVPPGEYEVTLPDAVLEQLGVTAPPLSIFVPPGAGEKRYPDLHLRLEPRT